MTPEEICELYVKVAQTPRMSTNCAGDQHRATFWAFQRALKEHHLHIVGGGVEKPQPKLPRGYTSADMIADEMYEQQGFH